MDSFSNSEFGESSDDSSLSEEQRVDVVLQDWISKTMDRIRGKKLREEEEYVLNNVYDSMKQMFTANGKTRLLIIILFFISTNATLLLIQFWFAWWGSNVFGMENQSNFYFFIFIFCMVSLLVISKDLSWTNILLKNLSTIYDGCVNHLIGAKKEWFDQNPANRIVYLLTKD